MFHLREEYLSVLLCEHVSRHTVDKYFLTLEHLRICIYDLNHIEQCEFLNIVKPLQSLCTLKQLRWRQSYRRKYSHECLICIYGTIPCADYRLEMIREKILVEYHCHLLISLNVLVGKLHLLSAICQILFLYVILFIYHIIYEIFQVTAVRHSRLLTYIIYPYLYTIFFDGIYLTKLGLEFFYYAFASVLIQLVRDGCDDKLIVAHPHRYLAFIQYLIHRLGSITYELISLFTAEFAINLMHVFQIKGYNQNLLTHTL